jgi:hypothetical protein
MKYFQNPADGQVFGYDETQHDLIASALAANWQDVTGNWPPAPTKTKAQVWEEIKSLRDSKTITCGYKVGTKWYHSDQISRTQQLGLVLMGSNIPSGLQWKTMDGSFVEMTQTLAQQILQAAAASDIAIFTAAEVHKAALETADPTTYDFSIGWPVSFE